MLLAGLEFVSHLPAQSLTLLKSTFEWEFERAASVTVKSQRNIHKKVSIEVQKRGIIYRRKSSGPRIEP